MRLLEFNTDHFFFPFATHQIDEDTIPRKKQPRKKKTRNEAYYINLTPSPSQAAPFLLLQSGRGPLCQTNLLFQLTYPPTFLLSLSASLLFIYFGGI
jgi:hypothetical protein